MAGLLHDIGKIAILKELTISNVALSISPENMSEDALEKFFQRITRPLAVRSLQIGIYDRKSNIASAIITILFQWLPLVKLIWGVCLAALVNLSDHMARILGFGKPIEGISLFELEHVNYWGLVKIKPRSNFLTIFRIGKD